MRVGGESNYCLYPHTGTPESLQAREARDPAEPRLNRAPGAPSPRASGSSLGPTPALLAPGARESSGFPAASGPNASPEKGLHGQNPTSITALAGSGNSGGLRGQDRVSMPVGVRCQAISFSGCVSLSESVEVVVSSWVAACAVEDKTWPELAGALPGAGPAAVPQNGPGEVDIKAPALYKPDPEGEAAEGLNTSLGIVVLACNRNRPEDGLRVFTFSLAPESLKAGAHQSAAPEPTGGSGSLWGRMGRR
ncbi:hypothetical protein J1605_014506 [Eschrichtius robustus]|uniref:Uncharacterized protein n=1 Tax=Eschrichtius robustus TaxID=9764 RepID=A0AB34GB77_ESCRO|nr:hypothetical protein J1605_014506 [Eschrichtius robustus]